jgi:hypothetical protein
MHLFQQSWALEIWIFMKGTQDRRRMGNPLWLDCEELLDDKLQTFKFLFSGTNWTCKYLKRQVYASAVTNFTCSPSMLGYDIWFDLTVTDLIYGCSLSYWNKHYAVSFHFIHTCTNTRCNETEKFIPRMFVFGVFIKKRNKKIIHSCWAM